MCTGPSHRNHVPAHLQDPWLYAFSPSKWERKFYVSHGSMESCTIRNLRFWSSRISQQNSSNDAISLSQLRPTCTEQVSNLEWCIPADFSSPSTANHAPLKPLMPLQRCPLQIQVTSRLIWNSFPFAAVRERGCIGNTLFMWFGWPLY